MAYPIDGTRTQERGLTDGTSKDLVITLPTLVQDDVYIFSFEVDNGSISTVVGDNSGAGGWTQQYDANYGGNWMYVYTSIIGATPDTTVTITCTTGNQNYSYASFAVRDADVSSGGANLIDASTSAQYAAAIGQTAPSLTTVSDNCIVVIAQGVGYGVAYKPREGMYIESQMENSYRSYVSLCSTYQQTAGATGTTKYYMGSNSNRNSQFFVFSIKNKSGGAIGGYVDKSVRAFEYIHLMMDDGYSGELGDNTEYDPTSVSYENISSLSNGGYSTSACLKHNNTGGAQDVVEYGVESWRLYRVSGANGDMLLTGTGITETYGSTDNYDLTGEKLMLSCKVEPLGFKGRSAIGACFGLSDKTNAKFWQIGSFDSIPSINAGYFPTVIDMDDSSFVMDDIGTPNMNNVGAIIWGHEPTSNYVYLHPAAVSIMRYITLVGGSSGLPCSFFNAYKLARDSAIFTVTAQGGLTEGQYFVAHDIRIGGSEAVYFDCTNQSCEWPSAHDAGGGKGNFKIGAAKTELAIDANSGDTVNMSTGVFNFANEHKFTIDATSHNSDIYTFTGRTIIGATVTLQNLSNVDYGGLTFDSCKEITLNGADISGSTTKGRVTISNGVDTNSIAPLVGATQAALQTLVDGLANVTFLNNNVAIRVEYTGTGDITLNFNNVTTTGNTTDIHYNSTNSSALTANMQNGSNLSTTAISGSATGVTIANDITATINVNVSGAEITILIGTQTELFHVETASTSEAYVYTYSSDFNGDIQVYKPGYKPYWLASNVFSNSNQTITVNLDKDPASQI